MDTTRLLTIQPGEQVQVIGRIFGAPLVRRGRSWLPVAFLLAWGGFSWLAGKRRPQRALRQRMGVGLLGTLAALGSEWLHNLAHAAAAQRVGKPADAIYLMGGLPRLVYHDVHDAQVTPQQHMGRAAGGPLANGLLWLLAALLHRRAAPGSLTAEMTGIAIYTNAFIACGGLLPLPPLDGGPLLKWGLVAAGRSPGQADQIVRAANGAVGVVLSGATALAVQKRHWLPAALLAQFAALCLGFALGWLKEN